MAASQAECSSTAAQRHRSKVGSQSWVRDRHTSLSCPAVCLPGLVLSDISLPPWQGNAWPGLGATAQLHRRQGSLGLPARSLLKDPKFLLAPEPHVALNARCCIGSRLVSVYISRTPLFAGFLHHLHKNHYLHNQATVTNLTVLQPKLCQSSSIKTLDGRSQEPRYATPIKIEKLAHATPTGGNAREVLLFLLSLVGVFTNSGQTLLFCSP